MLGVAAIEVYGSTETSGVAWRRAEHGISLLPSVEVEVPGELLEVRSPFSAATIGKRWATAPACAPTARSSLWGARIASRRSRTSVCRYRRSSGVCSSMRSSRTSLALALEDRARQYVGVVVELTRGRAALEARGKAAVNAALRASLRGHVDAVALPRAYRYPRRFPVDAQGKRNLASSRDFSRNV